MKLPPDFWLTHLCLKRAATSWCPLRLTPPSTLRVWIWTVWSSCRPTGSPKHSRVHFSNISIVACKSVLDRHSPPQSFSQWAGWWRCFGGVVVARWWVHSRHTGIRKRQRSDLYLQMVNKCLDVDIQYIVLILFKTDQFLVRGECILPGGYTSATWSPSCRWPRSTNIAAIFSARLWSWRQVSELRTAPYIHTNIL